MRIVQIVPYVGPGKGVAGVAWALDRAFRAAGVDTELFTADVARRGRPWPAARSRVGRRVMRAWRVLWFSTVGTARAREFLAERPDAVSICHSEALAGDVFVSHGVESLAVRTRKRGLWRLALNPMRAFAYARERHRYRSGVHRVVVTLSDAESRALTAAFGPVRPRVELIPNGVDLDRFHPPSPSERTAARGAFGLGPDDRVALLVGHDLERKGVDLAIDALAHAPSVLLMVVGGDSESVPRARAHAEERGVAERVLFAGTRTDIPFLMAASDMFVLPSAYEANALVVLEALACGLPAICTPVGFAPEVIVDGENGWLVPADARDIGERMERAAADDPAAASERCRASVADRGWEHTAQRYLALAESLAPATTGSAAS